MSSGECSEFFGGAVLGCEGRLVMGGGASVFSEMMDAVAVRGSNNGDGDTVFVGRIHQTVGVRRSVGRFRGDAVELHVYLSTYRAGRTPRTRIFAPPSHPGDAW